MQLQLLPYCCYILVPSLVRPLVLMPGCIRIRAHGVDHGNAQIGSLLHMDEIRLDPARQLLPPCAALNHPLPIRMARKQRIDKGRSLRQMTKTVKRNRNKNFHAPLRLTRHIE